MSSPPLIVNVTSAMSPSSTRVTPNYTHSIVWAPVDGITLNVNWYTNAQRHAKQFSVDDNHRTITMTSHAKIIYSCKNKHHPHLHGNILVKLMLHYYFCLDDAKMWQKHFGGASSWGRVVTR